MNSEGILEDAEQEIYPVSASIKMAEGKAVLEEAPFIFPEEQENKQDVLYTDTYNVMSKDLPVVNAPSSLQPAGVLKKGERVVFLVSDIKQWVKIKGESGITGWFRLKDFNILEIDGKEYLADDFFSDLSHVD